MAKRVSSVADAARVALEYEPKRLRAAGSATSARPPANLEASDLSDNDDHEDSDTFTQQQQQHLPRGLRAGAGGDADRHSCLAAPYAAHDPRTVRYFELAISKAKAPVVCASAGKIKGKAIYADRDIEQASRIWTEAPFVALQHEQNRGRLRCCQYCFVPLLSDYQAHWREMVARWNLSRTREIVAGTELPVRDDELDLALQQLKVHRKNCGLGETAATCSCGEEYCSKLCQLRAYHEFHSILCPRDDPYSAMNQFLTHMRHTNDIFFLAAKVVARLLSRFLSTRDVAKAREPMDMFYKKPWWEVVRMETQLQHCDGGDSAAAADMEAEAFGYESRQSEGGRPHAHGRAAPPETDLDDMCEELREDGNGIRAHELRELLTNTHEQLLDALESNLVHLARNDQLQGLSVDDIWTSCASFLSFEFFAAQLGLFEMNNVSMEIDHPFKGLIEILDPDVHDGSGVADGDTVAARVRRVLAHEESLLIAQQQQQLQRESSGSSRDGGYVGIDGTALFPIICTMNHSCDPNCTVLYTKDSRAHVVAVRDIKKGDELCICYIDIDANVRTRERNLCEYQFKCFCSRCSEERRALDLQSSETETAERAVRAGDRQRTPR